MIVVTIRIFLGITFVLSAVFKLIGMDEFELYLFQSIGVTWNLSSILARLFVSIELLLGLSLIFKLAYRKILYASLATLVLFSFWLGYQIVLGEMGNCHCFGEIISMDAEESVYKNIVLIGLTLVLLFADRLVSYRNRWLAIIMPLAAFILPLVISPPDMFFGKRYSMKGVSENIDFALLAKTMNEVDSSDHNIIEGAQILAFVSYRCSMCQLGTRKLTSIQRKLSFNIPTTYFILGRDTTGRRAFYEATKLDAKIPVVPLGVDVFLSVTKQLPTFIFVDDGEVLETVGYRSLSEEQLKILQYHKK